MSDCHACKETDHKDPGLQDAEINKVLMHEDNKKRQEPEMKRADIGGAHGHVRDQSTRSGEELGNVDKRPITNEMVYY